MKISKETKNKRRNFSFEVPKAICSNCGKPGPHFVPPSLGEMGFYICNEINRLSLFQELPVDN